MATNNKNFRVKNTIVTNAGSSSETIYPTTLGSNNQILSVANSATGELGFTNLDITLDAEPSLGGNLDTAGYSIQNGTNGAKLVLRPEDTGLGTIITSLVGQRADGSTTSANTYGGHVEISGGQAINSTIANHGGDVRIFGGSGSSVRGNVVIGGSNVYTERAIVQANNVELEANTYLTLNRMFWPQSDGSDGQVLTTDGNGNLSWADADTGALENIVEDLTPELGGNLRTQSKSIDLQWTTGPNAGVMGKLYATASGTYLRGDVGWLYLSTTNTGMQGDITIDSSLDVNINSDSGRYIYLDEQRFPNAIGANGQVLTVANSAAGTLEWGSNSGGISNVVDDTTPQLGGNLDLNSNSISGTGNINIVGEINLGTYGGGTNASLLRIYGNSAGTDSGTLVLGVANSIVHTSISAATSQSIDLMFTLPSTYGSNGQVLTTDGSGNLSFADASSGISNIVEDTTPQLGGNLDVQSYEISSSTGNVVVNDRFNIKSGTTTMLDIYDAAAVVGIDSPTWDMLITAPSIGFNYGTTNPIYINSIQYPTADGTNGQVLTTDGSGTLSFTDASSGGISNVVEDTTPQLGGNLDLNSNDITGTGNINTTGALTISGDAVIGGNLTINGTTTTINSTTLEVDDLNITVASGAADATAANGAGITVDGANATFNYVSTTDSWTVNKDIDVDMNNVNHIDNLTFSTATTANTASLSWNDIDGTIDIEYGSTGVSLQVGQENHVYAKASSTISNGDVVMLAGVQGDHLLIARADATSTGFRPEYVIGVATQDFTTNGFGYVTTFGKVRGLNLSAYDDGDILYLDAGNAGQLVTTPPTFPHPIIQVAAVVRSHQAEGVLMVRPSILSVEDLYGHNLKPYYDSADPETFTVTVAAKDTNHPYYANGSSNGYYINGLAAPFIKLIPGQTYVFDQSGASNSGHPLLFYYDENKNVSYTTGVTNSGTPGSAGATTTIVVSNNTPSTLYYQCSAHSLMGWGVEVASHNLTGLTTDTLNEGSTNLYYTDARVDSYINNNIDTDDVSEGATNQYFTQTRARQSISIDANTALTYNNTTGVIGFDDSSYLTSETYSTANELLTAIKTVHGIGSGLDADRLDDLDGSYYLNYNNFTNTPTSILNFGITDGTAGQVLQTDGSGNFSFTTVSGGGGAGSGYAGYEDYYYNVASQTSTFGTASNTHDKVQVYVNGVMLDDSDFSFVESTGIVTLTTAAENGDQVTIWGFNSTNLANHELFSVDSSGNITAPGTVQIGNHRKEGSLTSTISTTSPTNVVMYTSADYVGSKLVVTVTDTVTGDTQITEALILTVNGGTPKITTYGTMYTSTNALASFDVANVSTNTTLEVTMASTNSSTVKVAYTLIDA